MGKYRISFEMKSLALIVCFIFSATAHPDYSDTWEEFKDKYGKEYEDANEESYRKNVWTSNVEFIVSHNDEYDNGLHDFSVGENEFADMTSDEITFYFNGLVMDESNQGSGEVFHSDVSLQSLPTEIDWRKNGSVTPVKDQKQCGSCWAFSATGSLEAAHFAKTGKLVSLSEQNIVDCSKKEGGHGCLGGLMDIAFKYVKDQGGVDTEESYPYTAKTGKECLYNATNIGANLTSWVDIPHKSEADLQKAVGTVGPISVAIDASRPTFHFYKKGVYHDRKCSSMHLDHGVLAVGYGTHTPPGSNKKPKDYWLVKNSWGVKWGMEGYIMMARNKNNACGIATQASYPVV